MSRTPLLVLATIAGLFCAARAAEPSEIPVWSGVAPGSEGTHPAETWEERGKNGVVNRAVRQVHQPTLTAYLPEKSAATGVGLLLAPGGGFEHVTIDLEGHDVARHFVAQGIACFVLKYRLPKTPGANYTTDTTLADAVEALKVIRAHSGDWGVDPAKVGLMGFSAGGNLAALAGTKLPLAERPSFLALMYPAIPETLGPIPADVPPTFIVQANDDMLGTENALRFYAWMRAKKLSAELHLFAKGGHGFGLGKLGTPTTGWPQLFSTWLATTGFLPAPR